MIQFAWFNQKNLIAIKSFYYYNRINFDKVRLHISDIIDIIQIFMYT